MNARDDMEGVEGAGPVLIRLSRSGVDGGHRSGLSPGSYLALEVRDRGTGMDAATLQRATEPFFTTKSSGRGTGLGLSMVHGFARQSGGELVIESASGMGTGVTMLLPMAAAPPALPQTAPVPRSPPTRPLHVLLVDDDLVRESVAGMLREPGHDLREACSGAQALELLDDQAPDLLVTDHSMPGLTGLALARVARQRQPGLPILLVTGFADLSGTKPDDPPRLTKPFGSENLADAMVLALRHAAGLRA